MKYCVVKYTVNVIDGSINNKTIMLQNAINIGFSENEVEILTEEEYQARVELEPKPIEEPSIEERVKTTEETIMMLLMGGM